MRSRSAVLCLSFLLAATASDPPGFAHWTGPELRAYHKRLSPKINAQKVAVGQLGEYGNHSAIVVHREGSGESEVHENFVDVFVVQNGEGTLVVGGKVTGGRSTGPGEFRGASIEGGQRRKLGPGDVAHIPANTPHQVLLEPGGQITYLIVKIKA